MRKRLIQAIAAVLILGTTISGCSVGGKNIHLTTGLSDSELFKIDGSVFTVQEAKLYLTTEKNLYEQSFGMDIWDKKIGDVTFEEYVKNNVKNQLAEIKTMNLLAKEKKIKLTEEEKKTAKADAEKYYGLLTEADKKYIGGDLDDVYKAYMEYRLADKVYDELVKDINPEVSDAEAKVIKVASIYAKTYTIDSEGNRVEFTDEEKAVSRKNIEGLLEQIHNGGDFMTIAANNTDADQVEYQFGRGEMIQEFEDSAYALKTDEVSGIIETPDGYYIIKCISDYMQDETQENKELIIQNAKNEAFKKIYDPFVDSLASEFNHSAWNKIKFSDMKEVTVTNFYQCMS